VQQKRYRYTGKERDDSSGLCYYGARYLAPCSGFGWGFGCCLCCFHSGYGSQYAGCCFVALLGWLRCLVKVGSLFAFALGDEFFYSSVDTIYSETSQKYKTLKVTQWILVFHWKWLRFWSIMVKPLKTKIFKY
jgi:hypothetical protein